MSDLALFPLKLPDLKDAEAVQKFFLEEIQLGEELLSQGNTSSSSKLSVSAISVNRFCIYSIQSYICNYMYYVLHTYVKQI